MYKIYINETPLLLCSQDEMQNLKLRKRDFSFYYTFNKKRLHNVIDLLEKPHIYDRVILYSESVKTLWKDFKSIHKIIIAGGGIVYNDQKELLVIFRKGYWDLPKGKIEQNETKKEGAIREVMEECGIDNVEIIGKAGKTYHVYRHNNKKILKKSHWYFMQTLKQPLIPEHNEGILEAKWVQSADFLSEYSMYANIRGLLENIEVKRKNNTSPA